MALAEVFERVAGPDAPVEFNAYDGSQAGARAPRCDHASPRPPSPTWPRRRARSAWPGPTSPATWASRRHVRGAEPDGQRAAAGDQPTRQLRLLGVAGRPAPAAAAPGAAARRRSGSTAGGGRAAALQAAATPRRSRTTTTSPTRSTSGCSARRWPTPAPCYPRAGRHPGAGPGEQVRAGRPQAGAAARDAAAGRRLRLGRHGDARRPREACKALGVTLSAEAGPLGAAGDQGGRACATWPRSATWTTGTCPGPTSTRSARSG